MRDEIFYQTKNPVWAACFVLVCVQLIVSVSSFHLNLRGEVSESLPIKGQYSLDAISVDESDEFISRNEFDSTTTSIEAIILTTNSQMEQSKTTTEPIEEFDPIKRIKQVISNDDKVQTKLLIDLFYDVNGDREFRPLNAAAEACAVEVAQVLLQNGADVNVIGESGWRPIHVATHANCRAIVKMLKKRGADLNAKINLGYSALDIAVNDRNAAILSHTSESSVLLMYENIKKPIWAIDRFLQNAQRASPFMECSTKDSWGCKTTEDWL